MNIKNKQRNYFFLCLFFLKRFLRLWFDILCLFRFLPLGIIYFFYLVSVITKTMK